MSYELAFGCEATIVGTCNRHITHGIMKYRGSTREVETTDSAVAAVQTKMKLTWQGFMFLSPSLEAVPFVLVLLLVVSTAMGSRPWIASHAQNE